MLPVEEVTKIVREQAATVDDVAVFLNLPLLPEPHVVAMPTEKALVFPPPIGPLLPMQERPSEVLTLPEEEATEVVRGQLGTVDDVAGFLSSPLLPALGPVEAGMIDPKLTEIPPPLGLDFENPGQSPAGQPGSAGQAGAKPADPLGDGVLIAVAVITTLGLVYMAFIAFDYRQRWMQLLTTQNDRYLGVGAFDMEIEDIYGSRPVSFQEGFVLSHRSSI